MKYIIYTQTFQSQVFRLCIKKLYYIISLNKSFYISKSHVETYISFLIGNRHFVCEGLISILYYLRNYNEVCYW